MEGNSTMTSEPETISPGADDSAATAPFARELLTCSRCGYEWFKRTTNPVKCPACKSRYWNKGRVYKLDGKPEPTRKAKARGATFSSETAQEAANIRHHGEPNPPPEKPDGDT